MVFLLLNDDERCSWIQICTCVYPYDTWNRSIRVYTLQFCIRLEVKCTPKSSEVNHPEYLIINRANLVRWKMNGGMKRKTDRRRDAIERKTDKQKQCFLGRFRTSIQLLSSPSVPPGESHIRKLALFFWFSSFVIIFFASSNIVSFHSSSFAVATPLSQTPIKSLSDKH